MGCNTLEDVKLLDEETEARTDFKSFYFRLSDWVDDLSRKRWDIHRVRDRSLDPDECILALYKSIEGRDDADKYFGVCIPTRGYHQHRLALFFLRRYDLCRARRIIGIERWRAWLVEPLLLLMVLIISACVILGKAVPMPSLLYLVAYLIVVMMLLPGRGRQQPIGERLSILLQSMVPRLFGTVVVGMLFLVSSDAMVLQNLIKQINPVQILALFIGSWAILYVEQARRVVPYLGWRIMACRVTRVLVLAVTHALTCTMVMWRLLPGGVKHSDTSVLSVTGAVLIIGMIGNVIWQEEASTHPL